MLSSFRIILSAFVVLPTSAVTFAQIDAGEAAQPTQLRPDVEILSRGPVHEAFAEPVSAQISLPLVVDRAPPDPIEELPPEQVPEGNQVQWIPGYWGWDDDRGDFVWMSGVWRDCPPEQTWVPGYWNESDGGWSWTAGFWTSHNVQEVEYLPEPPATVEAGPNIDPPSENHIWVPGVWSYVDTRYVWRPGYWTVAEPDWMWVPAHYVRSPNGCIFVAGYWDYPLVRRGVLFAPVYYHEPLYTLANYSYTPSAVISTDLLTVHLFARPKYCHYYFGDYYGAQYRDIGIEPWLVSQRTRGFHDPIFAYYNWQYRREGRDWSRIASERYDFFDRNRDYRPAHTFEQLRRQRFGPTQGGNTNIQNVVAQQNNLVLNFNQYVQSEQRNSRDNRNRSDGFRFAQLDDDERRAAARETTAIRSFQKTRANIESADRRGRGTNQNAEDTKGRAKRSLSLAGLTNSETSVRERGSRHKPLNLPPRLDITSGRDGDSVTDNPERATVRNAPNGNTDRGNMSDPQNRIGRSGDRNLNPDTGGNKAAQTRTPNAPPTVNSPANTGITRDRAGQPTRNGRGSTLNRQPNVAQKDDGPNLNSPSQPIPRATNRGRDRSDLQDGDAERKRDQNNVQRTQEDTRRVSNYPPSAINPNNNPPADNDDRRNPPSRNRDTKAPSTTNLNSGDQNAAGRGGRGQSTSDQQRSANALRSRAEDNRDADRSNRQLKTNRLPGTDRSGQLRPPMGDKATRGSSEQTGSSQFNPDSSNRMQPRQANQKSSLRRQDDRGDRKAPPAPSAADRDSLRSSAGSQPTGPRPSRRPESTTKSDRKVSDEANKRQQKDKDKDDH